MTKREELIFHLERTKEEIRTANSLTWVSGSKKARHMDYIEEAICQLQDSVPIKPLAEWLTGYALPPNGFFENANELWENWLREFARKKDAEMQ